MLIDLPTRSFGQQGDEPTQIGLGGAVLENVSYAEGVATVRHAVELGITYYDTSPGYCGGRSQAIMGEGLAGANLDYMLATKLGYFANVAEFRHPGALRAQVRENLRLLQHERVDVLQVHEANWRCWWRTEGVAARGEQIRDDEEYDFAAAPVFEVLREAQAQGLTRYVGITGNVAPQMARILEVVTVDTFLMAFNYSPIWRGARERAIPLAKAKGVTLIFGAIYQGGRLVVPHPEWLAQPPKWMTPELQSRFARLYHLQKESGLSLATLAVRYVMSEPTHGMILVGAARPCEIEEAALAAQAGPLPDDLQHEIDILGVD